MAAGGLIHLLVEDTSARCSRASWDISAALSQTVGEIEAAGNGTLAGTVHTHPAGIPDPSGPDVATTRDALELNPHLGRLVIAVVTKGARASMTSRWARTTGCHCMCSAGTTGGRCPWPVSGCGGPSRCGSRRRGHHDRLGHQHHGVAPETARRSRTAAARAPTVVMLNHSLRLAFACPRPGPPPCSSTRATRKPARLR